MPLKWRRGKACELKRNQTRIAKPEEYSRNLALGNTVKEIFNINLEEPLALAMFLGGENGTTFRVKRVARS
jgi:hypothetical protein